MQKPPYVSSVLPSSVFLVFVFFGLEVLFFFSSVLVFKQQDFKKSKVNLEPVSTCWIK